MKLEIYGSTEDFGKDTLELLLENEVQNNLPVGFITDSGDHDTTSWFMATVKDEAGSILLTAACTPPFNLVMYLTRNEPNDAAVQLLSDEIKSMGLEVPGVLTERSLARRFAEIHCGKGGYKSHMAMNIMQLDEVHEVPTAAGSMRELRAEDLFFVPYWEHAFSVDCNLDVLSIEWNAKQLSRRTGKRTHYIWEDKMPVSQAVHGRSTQNGAAVNYVYTPPFFRGRGYATSVVAGLSRLLLERGNKFCCLFADASNPVSCSIYRKIGYRDQCVVEQLDFN